MPAGMCITIGEVAIEIDYMELTADINRHALMAAFGLSAIDMDKLELMWRSSRRKVVKDRRIKTPPEVSPTGK